MTTRQEWSIDLLAFGDWPTSAEKVCGIVSWGVAEGSQAIWNPLDTTEPAPGATNYNSAGVKNYPTLQVGLEAVYATLHNGFYGPILACLGDPTGSSAMALSAAVGRTPWGTGSFPAVVERVKADPARYYAEPVAGSGSNPPVPKPSPTPPPPLEEDEPMLIIRTTPLDATSRTYLLIGSGKVPIPDAADGGALEAAGIKLAELTTGFVAMIPDAT